MEKTTILMTFARNVRRLRSERGLSQEKLAEKAQLHRTYIGMIERCERAVTLNTVEKIAKALHVNIQDLIV